MTVTVTKEIQQTVPVAGRWEPSLTAQLLRACPVCRTPHPRARGLDQDTCPECGGPSSTGAPVTVKAKGGFWLVLANGFQAVANFLIRLSERL